MTWTSANIYWKPFPSSRRLLLLLLLRFCFSFFCFFRFSLRDCPRCWTPRTTSTLREMDSSVSQHFLKFIIYSLIQINWHFSKFIIYSFNFRNAFADQLCLKSSVFLEWNYCQKLLKITTIGVKWSKRIINDIYFFKIRVKCSSLKQ